jgi:hypothetical protein
MEIVQTGTATWRWCMSMFGARFAVFMRRARVLPGPCPATRNLSFSTFHRANEFLKLFHSQTIVKERKK